MHKQNIYSFYPSTYIGSQTYYIFLNIPSVELLLSISPYKNINWMAIFDRSKKFLILQLWIGMCGIVHYLGGRKRHQLRCSDLENIVFVRKGYFEEVFTRGI